MSGRNGGRDRVRDPGLSPVSVAPGLLHGEGAHSTHSTALLKVSCRPVPKTK